MTNQVANTHLPPNLPESLGQLYDWYHKNHRKLPFRQTKDFYSIWVSEIMLQQTRVEAMLPIYQNFLNRFPHVVALANADVQEVLAAWQGLGYYSRARNLHEGARQIVNQFNADFPADLEKALKIKGVGPYTAAAVLSISKGVRIAVVDGNVKRILARLFYHNFKDTKELQLQANSLLNLNTKNDVSVHNQAIMECGALICKPVNPLCSQCPLQNSCLVFQKNDGALFASYPPKKILVKQELVMELYLVSIQQKRLIVRTPKSLFFKNHWFLPYRVLDKTGATIYQSAMLEEAIAPEGLFKGAFRHSITRYQIQVRLYEAKLSQNDLQARLSVKQSDEEKAVFDHKIILESNLEKYIVSSIWKKARKFL